ncbi:MAG: hypothetical protein OEZ58_01160 [Gammaproteobacteria bacterium]|nr:hypothetical protein [Gammaproteobacteria bacterium]MDH5727585.1 hypothetical protein [Gammaproteobacteria bacterium]
MPYFVYKYENTDLGKLKELKKLAEFASYPEASKFAKGQRAEQDSNDQEIIKIMFADNELLAEEQIREKREPRPAGDD